MFPVVLLNPVKDVYPRCRVPLRVKLGEFAHADALLRCMYIVLRIPDLSDDGDIQVAQKAFQLDHRAGTDAGSIGNDRDLFAAGAGFAYQQQVTNRRGNRC